MAYIPPSHVALLAQQALSATITENQQALSVIQEAMQQAQSDLEAMMQDDTADDQAVATAQGNIAALQSALQSVQSAIAAQAAIDNAQTSAINSEATTRAAADTSQANRITTLENGRSVVGHGHNTSDSSFGLSKQQTIASSVLAGGLIATVTFTLPSIQPDTDYTVIPNASLLVSVGNLPSTTLTCTVSSKTTTQVQIQVVTSGAISGALVALGIALNCWIEVRRLTISASTN